MSELRDRFQAVIEGLLWPSETDAPIEFVEWECEDEICPEVLLQHLERPVETPIASKPLETFFRKVTRDRDWYDDTEKARVGQFQALVNLLAETLHDPQGFRIGETEIDAFVLGRTPEGHWAGIRTQIVET